MFPSEASDGSWAGLRLGDVSESAMALQEHSLPRLGSQRHGLHLQMSACAAIFSSSPRPSPVCARAARLWESCRRRPTVVSSVAFTIGTFMLGLHLKASDSRNSCRVRLVGPSFSPPVTGMMANALCSELEAVDRGG